MQAVQMLPSALTNITAGWRRRRVRDHDIYSYQEENPVANMRLCMLVQGRALKVMYVMLDDTWGVEYAMDRDGMLSCTLAKCVTGPDGATCLDRVAKYRPEDDVAMMRAPDRGIPPLQWMYFARTHRPMCAFFATHPQWPYHTTVRSSKV